MYRVVYSFHKNKSASSKALTKIKKIFENAFIDTEPDGTYVVVIGDFDNYDKAQKAIAKAVKKGEWGGIYERQSIRK